MELEHAPAGERRGAPLTLYLADKGRFSGGMRTRAPISFWANSPDQRADWEQAVALAQQQTSLLLLLAVARVSNSVESDIFLRKIKGGL
jgi:hypothetical protein